MREPDERLGRLLRLIRRRAGLRQEDIADVAGVPVRDVADIEAGLGGRVQVDRARRIFAAAGAQARLVALWNGAAADRLLDPNPQLPMAVVGNQAVAREIGFVSRGF